MQRPWGVPEEDTHRLTSLQADVEDCVDSAQDAWHHGNTLIAIIPQGISIMPFSPAGEKPSWTARLLSNPELLCDKVREEAGELCQTLKQKEGPHRAASEAADLLYHSLVLLNLQVCCPLPPSASQCMNTIPVPGLGWLDMLCSTNLLSRSLCILLFLSAPSHLMCMLT